MQNNVKCIQNISSLYAEGTFGDLKVNQRVTVWGMYNASLKTLIAKNIIIG
jgi:hypothetical protein